MSVNVGDFIRGEIFDWIYNHVDSEFVKSFPSKENFWVVPMASSEPDSKAVTKELLAAFKNTKLEKFRVIDGIGVAVVAQGERTIVCGGYLDGLRSVSISDISSDDFQKAELTFLQKMLVITKMGMTSASKIGPSVWKNNPIFEADVETHFPNLSAFELNADLIGEPADVTILRFLIAVESGCVNVREFHDELIEVMLSIPFQNHDWLTEQLLHSALAGRDSGFYFELYRLVEFFFPLYKVEKLKSNLKYEGATLNLLEICMTDLGWHVNHQLGSRMALNYSTISFAEIMLDKSFDGASEEQLKKFKEMAMEKLTELRHSLVHQNFKKIKLEPEDLRRATKSILSFLSSSFLQYGIGLQR